MIKSDSSDGVGQWAGPREGDRGRRWGGILGILEEPGKRREGKEPLAISHNLIWSSKISFFYFGSCVFVCSVVCLFVLIYSISETHKTLSLNRGENVSDREK